ncbi:MAG: ATP-binding protein, partial [Chthoniobacterales bacterium]
VDQWLFAARLSEPRIPSRMAVRTAIDLVLSAGALLCLGVHTRRGIAPAEILSALSGIIAFLALFGYSYGLITLYRTESYEPMSLPGTIAFISLAVAILLARTEMGAMRIIVSDTAAGLLARLLLPLGFLFPIALGALRLIGENAGLYSSRVGVALFATAFVIFFTVAIWRATRALYQSEMDRRAAVDHVAEVNVALEERVAQRTAELKMVNDELRQASKAKDDFLAVLSHELRTPLTPALAAADYLAEHGDLNEELREEANAIRASVQLEARLIDDLLDLTRIAHGKIDLHFEMVDAQVCLTKAVDIVRDDVRLRQLDVVTELGAGEHHVRADPVRLQQVFWNLISNAVKFTPRGGRITVRTWNDAPNLVVEVSDTGIGIDAAQQERIFAAFEQGEQTSSRQFGGLGLGLSISKKLLDLHDGTIVVRSEGKGRGAAFTVRLPAAQSAGAAADSVRATRSRTRSLDLLLVEDHVQTLRVLSMLLRKRGHKVATADSVGQALQLLDRARFDALISDIGLPDGTGCDLMRAAKERQGLRGIALSGFGMEEDIRRSKEAGFDHHLIKPVDFGDLEDALGRIGELS